jgi:mRNA capping enzyme
VPEFLVCFDLMERIALDYGLELTKKMNFHEYYNQAVNGDKGHHQFN